MACSNPQEKRPQSCVSILPTKMTRLPSGGMLRHVDVSEVLKGQKLGGDMGTGQQTEISIGKIIAPTYMVTKHADWQINLSNVHSFHALRKKKAENESRFHTQSLNWVTSDRFTANLKNSGNTHSTGNSDNNSGLKRIYTLRVQKCSNFSAVYSYFLRRPVQE